MVDMRFNEKKINFPVWFLTHRRPSKMKKRMITV